MTNKLFAAILCVVFGKALFASGCAGTIDQPETALSPSPVPKTISSAADSDPRRIHLSTKLISMSRADSERLDSYLAEKGLLDRAATGGLAHGRATGSRADAKLNTLCHLTFTELQSLLKFLQLQTGIRVAQMPQTILRNGRGTTVHIAEQVRHAENLIQYEKSGHLGVHARLSWPAIDRTAQLFITARVVDTADSVVMTIIPSRSSMLDFKKIDAISGRELGEIELPTSSARTVIAEMVVKNRHTVLLRGSWRDGATADVARYFTVTPTVFDAEVEGVDRQRPMETRTYRLSFPRFGDSPERTRFMQMAEPPMPIEIAEGHLSRSAKQKLAAVKSAGGTVEVIRQRAYAIAVTSTPDRLDSIGKLLAQIDMESKQVHVRVTLLVLSDNAAQEVSRRFLPKWQPMAGPLGTLGSWDRTREAELLSFVRGQPQGRAMSAPQLIVEDDDDIMIHVGGLFRYFVESESEGGGKLVWRLDGVRANVRAHVRLIPRVTERKRGIYLSVYGVAADGLPGELNIPSATDDGIRGSGYVPSHETAVVACGRGEWRDEMVNVLALITPTVIDFE